MAALHKLPQNKNQPLRFRIFSGLPSVQVASDLLFLPYPPDLARAGCTYACRALCRGQVPMSQWPFRDLRALAAWTAAELAFRRRLYLENVPHTNQCLTPLTNPDRAFPVIGQRRCELINQHLTRPPTLRRLDGDRARLLSFGARIPFTQASSYLLGDEDLFIFSFTLAPEQSNDRTDQAGVFLHPLPGHWAKPKTGCGPGQLRLSSNANHEIVVGLGGLDSERQVLSEKLRLPPGEPRSPTAAFASLAYLQRDRPHPAAISLASAGFQQVYRVAGSSWGNIQVNGHAIILAGYITRRDYFRKAQLIASKSEKPNPPLNYSLPIQQLHPLTDLFERARAWAKAENS